jgi:hypothetical protein
VPTRGSHPNARSAVSVEIWRQLAASGRMSNACTRDATRDCLVYSKKKKSVPSVQSTTRIKKKKKKNAPSDPLARSKRIPSLLPDEKFREFGRDEVVYG